MAKNAYGRPKINVNLCKPFEFQIRLRRYIHGI